MESFNIFILAAGLGERLKPITNHIPKPLLPVMGKPVLQHILERLNDLPFNRIGINIHYMADKIKDWIMDSPYSDRIDIFYEEIPLGTGGALRNASALLRKGIFLVHNSDIISDIDLSGLIEKHISSGNLATLAVHDHPDLNKLIIDRDGNLLGLKGQGQGDDAVAFTGIAVYSPDFLRFLPDGICSVVDGWLNAISKGFKIGTMDVTGNRWHDIGTPLSYAKAIFEMLKECGERSFIHPSSSPPPDHDNLPIGVGGSDRRYYRIKRDGLSRILMLDKNREDFIRNIEYTGFFKRHSVPVPEIIDVDYDRLSIILEDLGDTTLYNWLQCKRMDEEIEDVYKKALDILTLLHTTVTDNVSECPILEKRVFDLEYFRWEGDYFIDRFIRGIKGMDLRGNDAINGELDLLAHRADSFPKTVIHRDFQSQNIMITERGLYIIDYQGARIGPPGYDVVSILWDPYHPLDDGMRQRLLGYYIDGMKKRAFDEDAFIESLKVCRLQRHMQALGAYGFLSIEKGKPHFLRFIPEAIKLLKEDIEDMKDDCRGLYDLIMSL
ncbi:MAG: hypothetical protein Fur0020_07540 [Thermodesulfovibrionia bacterium]